MNSTRLTYCAPAKLNLFLQVSPVRPDGFHDISTLTVLLDLCDTLEFQAGPEIKTSALSIECRPSNLLAFQLPQDKTNLVVRAMELLKRSTGCPVPTSIRLIKRIPTESGLGGGSSDAASTLLALNQLWKLELSLEQLRRLASELGSDVPLFLNEVYSCGSGRGEIVEPLFDTTSPPRLHFVLLKPDTGLATKDVYKKFDSFPDFSNRRIEHLTDALASSDIRKIANACFNSLQLPAEQLMPELPNYRSAMKIPGVLKVQMTGSGSCLFALCEDESAAKSVESALSARFPTLFLCRASSLEKNRC